MSKDNDNTKLGIVGIVVCFLALLFIGYLIHRERSSVLSTVITKAGIRKASKFIEDE